MTLAKASPLSVVGTKSYFTKNERLDIYFVSPQKIDSLEYIKKVATSKGFDIVDLEELLKIPVEKGTGKKEDKGDIYAIVPGCLTLDFLVDLESASKSLNYPLKKRIANGDILLLADAHSAGYIGKNTSIVMLENKEKATYTGHLIRLRPNQDRINPFYLLAYLNFQDVRLLLQHSVRGQTIGLYPNDIRNLPVILPPRDIQDSIGGKLRKSIENKLKAKKKKREINEIFAKYLPKFSIEKKISFVYSRNESQTFYRMDPTFFSPFIRYAFSKLKEKPHFYLNVNKGFYFYRGKTPLEGEYTDDGTVVIKVGSINGSGILDLKKQKSCLPLEKAINKFKKAFVNYGDVIFVATGKGSIGKTTIYLDSSHKCMISGELIASRYIKGNLDNFVVAGFFMSEIGKKILEILAIGSTGQTHLYPEALRLVPIPKINTTDKAKFQSIFMIWFDSEQSSKALRDDAMSELEQLLSVTGGVS